MKFAGTERTFVFKQTRGTKTGEAIIPVTAKADLGTVISRKVAAIVVVAIVAITTIGVARVIVPIAGMVITTIAGDGGAMSSANDRGNATRPWRTSQ